MDRDEYMSILKELATPIDFEALVEQGVLVRRGAWYEVLDWDRLPERAKRKIRSVQDNPGGGRLVKFSRPTKETIRLYEKLKKEQASSGGGTQGTAGASDANGGAA